MTGALASGVLLVGVVGQAQAATTIGQTFTPTVNCSDFTALQTGSPSAQYLAPNAGVITAWSFQAGVVAPNELRLKVARPAGGPNNFTIIGESSLKDPAANMLNTYTDVRIPVLAGDVIGLRVGTGTPACARSGPTPGYAWHRLSADDPNAGETWTFTPVTGPGATLQFDVAARLEPDADEDQFGDETQDQCPTNAATQGACPVLPIPPALPDADPPETTITKGAPSKTDKSTVKFKFTSDEAGGTFECKLDKKPFKPCTSPKKVKRLDKGKHKFMVRAVDAAGNVDPTADKDKFRVVD